MANIFIILTIVTWGVGSFLGKTALKNTDAVHIYLLEALGTLTIASITALFFRKEFRAVFTEFNWSGYLFGILFGIGTVTFILALKYKSASVATSLAALYPAVTVVLAVIFLKEPLTLKIFTGITMALGAAFLLF